MVLFVVAIDDIEGLKLGNTFNLDALMMYINYQADHSDGCVIKLFVRDDARPVYRRSLKDPHITIRCPSEMYHYIVSRNAEGTWWNMNESQLRAFLSRVDPKDYM